MCQDPTLHSRHPGAYSSSALGGNARVPRRDFRRLAGWIAAFFFAAMTPAASNAEEIKLLAAGALRQTISELLPQFEKDAGHRVSAAYGPIGALTDRLAKGEAADVAIVSDAQIADLQKLGKIIPGTRLDIAKTGVGSFVRKNGPKPDISSVDAFRRTLLAAKTVTWSDPAQGGAAGIYMAHLTERLGILPEMNSKTEFGDAADSGAPRQTGMSI